MAQTNDSASAIEEVDEELIDLYKYKFAYSKLILVRILHRID